MIFMRSGDEPTNWIIEKQVGIWHVRGYPVMSWPQAADAMWLIKSLQDESLSHDQPSKFSKHA